MNIEVGSLFKYVVTSSGTLFSLISYILLLHDQ